MASLESLPDDCLREILQYCDTNDHIALVVAFEQLKGIVQDIWKILWKMFLLLENNKPITITNPHTYDWRVINSESLKIVLDLMQPFVEEIEIFGQNKEKWDIINESQFTKASKLRLWKTSASAIVKSCFPNLRSLELAGNSVVKYNPEWNGLEKLDASRSQISTSELMEFVSKLKLKNFTFGTLKQPVPRKYRFYEYFSELEEISGSISTWRKFAKALNVMPKLRKVSVKYDCPDIDANISMLSKILETRAVELFISCTYPTPPDYFKYLENRLQELPNLKRLKLECFDMELIQRFSRFRHLHLLKAIILKDMRVDAEVLTNILISLPQLELLDILSSMIISTIHLDVASIAQKRSKPVIINVEPWGISKFEILLSASTDLIKITKNRVFRDEVCYEFEYILDQK